MKKCTEFGNPLFVLGSLLAFVSPLKAGDPKPTPQLKDFDAPYFEGAKAHLLRAGQEPGMRSGTIPHLVERNAREAIPVLVSLLDDPAALEEKMKRLDRTATP